MGAQGAQGAGRGEEGGGGGVGCCEELAAGEVPLFLPTSSFMASADGVWGAGHDFFCSFFCSDSFPL